MGIDTSRVAMGMSAVSANKDTSEGSITSTVTGVAKEIVIKETNGRACMTLVRETMIGEMIEIGITPPVNRLTNVTAIESAMMNIAIVNEAEINTPHKTGTEGGARTGRLSRVVQNRKDTSVTWPDFSVCWVIRHHVKSR